MKLKEDIAIIGVGVTPFGELFEKSFEDLVVDAAYEAYADAGVTKDDVDAAWLGTTETPYISGNDGEAPNLGDYLALFPKPVSRVANFCTTGMEAVRHGAMAVASGMYKMVLVVGAEKMRDVPSRGSLIARHVNMTHPVLCKGRTAPGQFAIRATRYLHEYKLTDEVFAKVAVKNHKNGALNPKAHFRKEITLDQAMKAQMVAEPLKLYDCCPTTDGAAAVILTTKEEAQKRKADYVLLQGIGLAVTGGYYTTMFDADNSYLNFRATQEAAKQAYAQAGIENPRKDLDVAECHDCFTITELLNYEDLGFCKKGEGYKLIEDGVTHLDGEFPVNTSGGLKSTGHPIGATGVRMVSEITQQLRGRCEKRQVKNAKRGLAHTLGGPGIVSCVMVLGR